MMYRRLLIIHETAIEQPHDASIAATACGDFLIIGILGRFSWRMSEKPALT